MITVLSVVHGNTFGGPHNRNVKVSRRLAEDDRIRTLVLLPQEAGNAATRMRQQGVEVVELPIPRLRARLNPSYHWHFFRGFQQAVQRIEQILVDEQVDLVQINGISNPHAAVAARRQNVPLVWQILDTFPPHLFLRLMMPYVRRTAGAIMSTGQRVAEAHPGATTAADRLIYFYPPVDTCRFRWDSEQAAAARAELGLSSDAMVIGNVSNLNPQRVHRTFIRAAASLKKNRPGSTFVILGKRYEAHRDYIESMLSEARTLGLDLDTDLIIRDPGDRVAELEMAFDVFAMTSEPRSEGIPTVIEEAMSLGLPVVSTDVGSIREIVREDETGRLTPAGDSEAFCKALTAVLDDPVTARRMGAAGRAMAARQFTVESCAQRHYEAYRLALGGQLSDAPD